MNEEDKTIKKALEYIAHENLKNSEKLMTDCYKYKREQRDKLIEYIVKLYATYTLSNEGGLVLTQAQKKKIKMQLKDYLSSMAIKLGNNEEEIVTKALKNSVLNTYNKTNFMLDIGLSFNLPIGGLDNKTISYLINKQLKNKSFSTRIWNNQQEIVNQLNKQVNNVIAGGKDVKKATKVIKDRFNVSAYNAKRIVENETKNVQTRVQNRIYKQSDIVTKVMWSATLDERTREEHRHLDGQIWDSTESHPTPEDYVMCRCALIPIIDRYKPDSRYCQSDGKTIDFRKYTEWKKQRDID